MGTNGQLGSGHKQNLHNPTLVKLKGREVLEISSGAHHTVALLAKSLSDYIKYQKSINDPNCNGLNDYCYTEIFARFRLRELVESFEGTFFFYKCNVFMNFVHC